MNTTEQRVQDARDHIDLAAGRHDELFARYWSAMRASAGSVGLWREADLQDALQMAAERLIREWGRGKRYGAPLRIVIPKTAYFVALGVKKAAAIQAQRAVSEDALRNHAGPDAFAGVESIDWMARAFEILPPRERAVMELRYLADMPPQHVAEVLDIDPNAENQAHFRAVRTLRLSQAA